MKNIVVTGASGRLGSWVVKDLLEHGYQVLALDEKPPEKPVCKSVTVNLNSLGEVYGGLSEADAVIHLAAIPAPLGRTNEFIFANNVLSTYNILEAAAGLGIPKAVIASSESSYGFAWAKTPFSPHYVPVDESHPQLPQECYGLSKIVNEQTAAMFHRRSQMQIVSMRFSMVVMPDAYKTLQVDRENTENYKRNLWSYIDVRDAASSCRAAMEADGLGVVELNITADDTISPVETRELVSRFYPDIQQIRTSLDSYQALVSNEKAKRCLNWQPIYSWREEIQPDTK